MATAFECAAFSCKITISCDTTAKTHRRSFLVLLCFFFLSVSSSTPLMTREQRYTVLLLLAFAITWECSLKPLLLLLDNRNTPCTHNIFVCIILRFVCKAGKLTNVSDTQSGRERRRACGQSSVPAKSHQPHNEQPYQKYRASEWVSEGNSKMAIPIW